MAYNTPPPIIAGTAKNTRIPSLRPILIRLSSQNRSLVSGLYPSAAFSIAPHAFGSPATSAFSGNPARDALGIGYNIKKSLPIIAGFVKRKVVFRGSWRPPLGWRCISPSARRHILLSHPVNGESHVRLRARPIGWHGSHKNRGPRYETLDLHSRLRLQIDIKLNSIPCHNHPGQSHVSDSAVL
jgi:hypothetical protein